LFTGLLLLRLIEPFHRLEEMMAEQPSRIGETVGVIAFLFGPHQTVPVPERGRDTDSPMLE
jgi:hypothetical protein